VRVQEHAAGIDAGGGSDVAGDLPAAAAVAVHQQRAVAEQHPLGRCGV
jgi:hypothetical protein